MDAVEARKRICLERARYWQELAEMEKPSRLVENWRSCWKWASMQFNALAAILVGVALNNLDILASVLSMAPPEVRALVPFGASVGLFVIVAVLRLWKQNHV